MRNFIVLLGMLFCLFAPSALFTVIGYRCMETLSRRPSQGPKVLVALLTKLVIAAVVIIDLLMLILKVFATES